MLVRQKKSATKGNNALPSIPGSVRVAIYLRVSTEDQKESGLGIADQRYRTTAMAEVKGWQKPIEFADEGISGTKDFTKRPGLRSLLESARAGELDVVIISEFSRLARQTRMLLNLFDELSGYGVNIVSCKESLDTETPAGRFALTMFAAIAQLERDNIADRTRGALDELGRTRGVKGGKLPYGYVRTDDKSLEVDQEHAEVAREVFRLRKLDWAMRTIATHLNEKGVTAPRGGDRWYASSVREILLNEQAYRGGHMSESEKRWPVILEA